MGHEYLQHLLHLRGYPNRYASDFSATEHITAVGDLLAPATPSSLSASNELEEIHVSWTNPATNADGSTCNDFKWAKVYYKSTTGVTTSSYDGTYLTSAESWVDEQTVGTTRYYIITALDATGNESAASSEVNGTSLSITASTSVPADASGLVFDDSFGTDGVVTGDSMLGIVFKNPATDWVNFNHYRLWYQWSDDAGTTWYDEDSNPSEWTEIGVKKTGYIHKGLTPAYDYRYKATAVGDNGDESTTADTAGGVGTKPNGTDNDLIVATLVLAENLIAINEVRGTHIKATSTICINDRTFGNDGIQLDYNAGNPRAYIGDGANAFWQFDGTKITWKAANTELDGSGNLIATSVTLTGAITASSGSVGSFTIGTYLYTGSKTAYNDANAGVHLGSDGLGIGNNVFTVSSAGALIATSATITGTITANAGTIGGFTCDSTNGLYSGAAATRIQMKAGVGLWLGATAYADATFKVSPAGAVVATSFTTLTDGNANPIIVGGQFRGMTLLATDEDTNTGTALDLDIASLPASLYQRYIVFFEISDESEGAAGIRCRINALTAANYDYKDIDNIISENNTSWYIGSLWANACGIGTLEISTQYSMTRDTGQRWPSYFSRFSSPSAAGAISGFYTADVVSVTRIQIYRTAAHATGWMAVYGVNYV